MQILASSPMQKIYGKPRKRLQSTMQRLPSRTLQVFRATSECYNDRCFRIHLKGTRRKQTQPSTQEPSITLRITNQQQAMIKTQNLAYNRPPPLLTLPTQHTTAHHSMLFLIQPAHPQPHSIPSSSSNICTCTTNTLSYFSQHRHPTSILHPTPQYPRWVPANDTKWHNCE